MCQGIFKDETVRLMTFRKCEIALQDLAYVIVMAKHEKTEASGTFADAKMAVQAEGFPSP
eukprot:scaffold123950_cov17-Tisochrysis_lutea.AAC.1